MTYEEIKTKLTDLLQKSDFIEAIPIADNMQLWVQNENGEWCIELQVRESNTDYFGECNINMTEFFPIPIEILITNINYYQQKFTTLSFDKFVDYFCD